MPFELARILLKNNQDFLDEFKQVGFTKEDADRLLPIAAIQKCVNKSAFEMMLSGISKTKTWRYANCTPFPLRIKGTLRSCDLRICPWCHLRKVKSIFQSISKPSYYSICKTSFRVRSGDINILPTKEEIDKVKRHAKNIKRRLGNPYASTFQIIPELKSKSWLIRSAVMLPRHEFKVSKFDVVYNPKSTYELISIFYPYPAGLLLLKGDTLKNYIEQFSNYRALECSRGYQINLHKKRVKIY
jgi:hypothetical protein